jgi:transmembrane sensor
VQLLSGEAFFTVSKRPDWPFVVQAGNREVTAVGTAFAVRRDETRMAVTLVEGKVAVTAVAQSLYEKATPSTPPMVLSPGERLTFDGSAQPPKLDRPQVDKVTAWRQGVVDINDMTLAEALKEMSRYSKVKLAAEGAAANIRVGGVFRSTDAQTFAKGVALTHGLSLREEGGRIVLSGTPRPATEEEFDVDSTHESQPQ